MPKERPHLTLNPVEEACERIKRQKREIERVRTLNPDRDLTWESTEDFTSMELDSDGNYFD
ncbi:Uncharacterised protein [Ectopseudomonas mendocina]|uniref:Uncharacterized protein n=1 Tax=Ectopseudomonas mendocina TaxID=300 RepID=A0A379PLD3_ECTME|nr:hypothetical protein [Pseudomonas mendocina]SUE95780.1 Uncharacterised protein [Pseudomonas mendocina]